MNAPTSAFWIQLFAVVAAEVIVVMGLAILVQWLTKSAVWRRMLWQVAIVSLAILVVLEVVGAGRGMVGWMGARLPARAEATPPVQPQAAMRPASDAVILPAIIESVRVPTASAVPNSQIVSTIAARRLPAPNILVNWLPGLVWLLGFSVLGGRVLVGQLMLEWFRYRCHDVDDESLRERIRELSLRLGIRKRIRLVESAKIQGLIAFGLLRPTIGLPSRFAQNFRSAEQEAMLAHELAHLSAHDPAWHLLADWLAAALWWHPLVWWSRQQFLKASEAAADESCLLVADGPQVLADCLVKLGARLTHPQPFGWTGIGGKGFKSGLAQRVERLIRLSDQTWQPPNRISFASAKIAGPVAVAIVAMLCTAWAGPEPLQKANHEETVMKRIQQSWKCSAAAMTLAAVLSTANTPALADDPPNSVVKPPPAVAPPTAANPSASTSLAETKGAQAIKAKLERIVLPQVFYDGLPLGEVIKHLIDESAKRDPDKLGVNFMISNTLDAPTLAAVLDPATGLPLPASATEPIIVDNIIVKIFPPLKQVRMIDVLDAITKVADRPVKYSIEDYAVIFSQGPVGAGGIPFQPPAVPVLHTRWFKLDPNTLTEALREILSAGASPATLTNVSGSVSEELRQFLTSAGVDFTPGKGLFLNGSSGMLMVRATLQDLDIIEEVVEALNPALPQIKVEVKFCEIAEDVGEDLGFDWLPKTGTYTSSFTPTQFRTVIRALEQRKGVDILSSPCVTTLSGRQTQIKVVDLRYIVIDLDISTNPVAKGTGSPASSVVFQPITQPFELGPMIEVVPMVQADGFTILMTVTNSIKEFFGYDDPAGFVASVSQAGGAPLTNAPPLPIFRLRRITASGIVMDGQTLVLAGGTETYDVKSKGKTTALPASRIDRATLRRKTLVVFVTPTIIDPAGNPVHTEEELQVLADKVSIQKFKSGKAK